MLLYAITSRILLGNTESERTEKLIALAASWALTGVDFIQIREKDLAPTELLRLSTRIVRAVRDSGSLNKVLINGSPENASAMALQTGADGVHLPSGLNPGQLAAEVIQMRRDWERDHKSGEDPIISASCHTVADVTAARSAGATLALFAPVFEKAPSGSTPLRGHGLKSLAEACHASRQPSTQPELPVVALGGVTLHNASDCVAAGAIGIAAIRLFADAAHSSAWQQLKSL